MSGTCIVVPDRAAAQAELSAIESYASGAKRCSLVDGVGETNFDLAAVSDPTSFTTSTFR